MYSVTGTEDLVSVPSPSAEFLHEEQVGNFHAASLTYTT